MSVFVLDACVAITSLRPHEPEYRAAFARLRSVITGVDTIVVPAIFPAEMMATLGRGGLDARAAGRATSTFLAGARLVTIGPRFALAAGRVAATAKLKGMDAIYVALASREGLDLVTLDQEVIDRAARVGVTAVKP
jgi:predicted nucleic acid-binding protein